jgi:hypothetical protein
MKLWCMKFPLISSTYSIFLPLLFWSFRVCRSPPHGAARPTSAPLDDAHASHEPRGERHRLRRRILWRGSRTAALPHASLLCSQHNPHFSLPPAPASALATCRIDGLPRHVSRRHRLLPTSPDIEPWRQSRPTQSSCLKCPSPSDLVFLAGESSNHAFLLISPVLLGFLDS